MHISILMRLCRTLTATNIFQTIFSGIHTQTTLEITIDVSLSKWQVCTVFVNKFFTSFISYGTLAFRLLHRLYDSCNSPTGFFFFEELEMVEIPSSFECLEVTAREGLGLGNP
ncbi:hypothetical protein IHE45_14G062900 [Dioscorea alata]|uniref:Uncharacterized protein n=1 Tax=Dioscorea alata TaxID=55571 RepID=A0ACB7US53_DIOAL|nr:hypothetical protein IHE45_14G062900 [Dioscorea alata]